MKLIVTVIGNDKVGIVAAVSQKLAELEINILDITQTLMQGNFTMVLLGESHQSEDAFSNISTQLLALEKTLGVSIRVQRQEIFDAIQKI
jgi:ACT domain-containing protein